MTSSSNPRKFAEKIAKLQQKEQEQTMAFEQIMAEVIVATRGGGGAQSTSESKPQSGQLLRINQNSSTRAESLPNVNHMSVSQRNTGIDLQSALNSLEEIKQGRAPSNRERRHASPNSGTNMASRSHHSTIRSMHPASHHTNKTSDHHRRASPASPYSTPYLSPPDVWRRTNSDSALHQSALMAERNEGAYCNASSANQGRRSPVFVASSSLTNISNTGDHNHHQHHSSVPWVDENSQQLDSSQQEASPQQHPPPQYTLEGTILHSSNGNSNTNNGISENNSLRPKSCDVPGITIYPSQEEPNTGHHHVPISANTGSLPDLTSFHFPAPLATPIDVEESILAGSNTTATASNSQSASSNPSFHLQNSPGSPYGHRTLQSPYSVNSNPNSPYSPQSPLSGLGYSPPPPTNLDGSVSNTVQQQQQLAYDTSKQDIQQQTVGYGHPSHVLNQAQPPMITVEGLALDTSQLSLNSGPRHASPVTSVASSTAQVHNFNGGQVISDSIHAHNTLTNLPSATGQSSVLTLNLTGDHRQQQQQQQPSQQQQQQFPTTCTTSPSSPHSVDKFFTHGFQANSLQSQFEQFRVVGDIDNVPMCNPRDDTGQAIGISYTNHQKQVLDDATFLNFGVSTSTATLDSPSGAYIKSNGSQNSQPNCILNEDGSIGQIINSPASLMFSKSVISCASSSTTTSATTNYHMPQQQHHQQQQQQQRHTISPAATTGIPNIVLTEPASDAELLHQEYTKDLSGGSFDGDLFGSETFERPELSMDSIGDPIDFEGLHLLQELTDSSSEVRLDRS